jgi:hypothetical protein
MDEIDYFMEVFKKLSLEDQVELVERFIKRCEREGIDPENQAKLDNLKEWLEKNTQHIKNNQ